MRSPLALLLCTLTALPLESATCDVDILAVETRIAELEPKYGMVLSDIGCEVNSISARQMMCDSSEQPNSAIWRMGGWMTWHGSTRWKTRPGKRSTSITRPVTQASLPPATPAPTNFACAR